MGACLRCGDTVPDPELIDHLRILHPDVYEPVETWPDGAPVIVDLALDPGEFG